MLPLCFISFHDQYYCLTSKVQWFHHRPLHRIWLSLFLFHSNNCACFRYLTMNNHNKYFQSTSKWGYPPTSMPFKSIHLACPFVTYFPLFFNYFLMDVYFTCLSRCYVLYVCAHCLRSFYFCQLQCISFINNLSYFLMNIKYWLKGWEVTLKPD